MLGKDPERGVDAVADDRLDELDLALGPGTSFGFISCWGVRLSIPADDSIGELDHVERHALRGTAIAQARE